MLGHHSTQSITLFSSLYFLIILLVITCQITRFPSSSPEAKYYPQGDTDIVLTQVLWNLYSIETYVGKGFKSLGCGNSGISYEGSVTLTFFFITLGQRYRSRHLSKCSLIKS